MGDSEEMKYCNNCKRDIAAANFVMHEIHCRRNIVLCKHCKEPVPRTEMDDHYEEYHAEVACDLCSKSIEKQKMEEHKDDCPKRQVKCSYCEIDLPFCDLKEHLEYCGTRTEPCVKCGQYIMQKDLNKHEDSNCTFPQPKSTNVNAAASGAAGNPARSGGGRGGPERLVDHRPPGYYNNFAMDELERILHDPSLGGGGASRGAAIPRVSNPIASSSRGRAPPPSTRNAGVTGTKRTTIKKTNNSAQRNSHVTGPSGSSSSGGGRSSHQADGIDDMDHLLAMHLAQDLSEEDLNNRHGNNNDSNTFPARSNSTVDDQGNNALDQTALPCEFCGDLLPIDNLIQHQATCLGGDGISVPNVNLNPEPQNRNADLPNNSPSRASQIPAERPHDPPIVDNLSYLAAQDWLSNPSEEFADDILLPCEFCDVLFPEDLLIQHQAVCDANRAQTPPTRGPPAARPSARRTPASRRMDASAAARAVAPPRHRLAKRQNDPGFAFLGGDSGSPSPGGPSIRSKPNNTRAKVKPRQPLHSHRGASNGLPASHVTSQTGRAASRNAAGPSFDRNARDEEPDPTMRRRGSAARVRQTLDDFIEDPMGTHPAERPWSSSTYTLEHDKEEKSSKNSRIKERENGESGRASVGRRYVSTRNGDTGGATSTSSSSRPTGSRKPKLVPRSNFTPDFDREDEALRVRNGTSGTTSRAKKKAPVNRRGRQPDGDL